jgi:hypothetical protein
LIWVWKAHEAVVIAGEVVLAQLHDGVGEAAGAGIDEAHRLHRPEPQRVVPRCAITSMGRQPSKNVALSKSCTVADSAVVSAS